MRVMAIDYGGRRVGVALSDRLGLTAQPYSVIDRKGKSQEELIAEILEIIRREQVEEIAVGLPVSLNGSEGDAAAIIRRFAQALADAAKIPLSFEDERLTTAMANRALIEGNVGAKKSKGLVDKVAASIILQSYLEKKRLP